MKLLSRNMKQRLVVLRLKTRTHRLGLSLVLLVFLCSVLCLVDFLFYFEYLFFFSVLNSVLLPLVPSSLIVHICISSAPVRMQVSSSLLSQQSVCLHPSQFPMLVFFNYSLKGFYGLLLLIKDFVCCTFCLHLGPDS